MTAIDIAAYMPLDYVARIGKALADAGAAYLFEEKELAAALAKGMRGI